LESQDTGVVYAIVIIFIVVVKFQIIGRHRDQRSSILLIWF